MIKALLPPALVHFNGKPFVACGRLVALPLWVKTREQMLALTDWVAPVLDTSEWTIQGNGGIYTIRKHDTGFTCTCDGYYYRHACRHIRSPELWVSVQKT